jgi:hypothetical protein
MGGCVETQKKDGESVISRATSGYSKDSEFFREDPPVRGDFSLGETCKYNQAVSEKELRQSERAELGIW